MVEVAVVLPLYPLVVGVLEYLAKDMLAGMDVTSIAAAVHINLGYIWVVGEAVLVL
jgi:uncharacterized membrane protein YjjP (DUF1212 family)